MDLTQYIFDSPILLEISLMNTYWQGNTFIAKLIILFILGLLITSYLMYLKNQRRMVLELSNLHKLDQNLEEWKRSSENMEAALTITTEDGVVSDDYEEEIVTIFEASIEEDLMPGIDRDTMIYERLMVLDELRNTKSRINVGVLQQLTEIQYSIHPSVRLPSYVMTLAMLLGMLGTFIGLTMMVGAISSQLSGFDEISSGNSSLETFKSSFEGIQSVMQGVGTAFTTTLFGLTCTILVSMLNFLQNRKKAIFFNQFEQFTVKKLLPHTFPDMEQEEVINAIKDQLRETFEKLNRTIDKNRKTLGNIDGLYQKFDSVVDTVKSVMAAGSTAELHGVVQEIQVVNQNLVQIIDKYENRRLLDDFHKVADKYEGYLSKHDFILEQSKWLPNARVFMILIASILGVIALLLSVKFFF